MIREEHLAFCKKCDHRQMDIRQGLICSLTSEKADFVTTCPDFNPDPGVQLGQTEAEILNQEEIHIQLPDNVYQKLRLEQNYLMAVAAGLIAGLIGAVLWGVITAMTNYQIGFMAVAIGAGVGYAMKYAGKGIDMIFGVSGALIAVASCALGNFLSIIGFIANAEGLSYLETLSLFDFNYLLPLMAETFSPMDIVFYGIAGYVGFKFAFRTITEKNLILLK